MYQVIAKSVRISDEVRNFLRIKALDLTLSGTKTAYEPIHRHKKVFEIKGELAFQIMKNHLLEAKEQLPRE